jgi:hypothetical protein
MRGVSIIDFFDGFDDTEGKGNQNHEVKKHQNYPCKDKHNKLWGVKKTRIGFYLCLLKEGFYIFHRIERSNVCKEN